MLPENDDTFLSRWLDGSLSVSERQAFEASGEAQPYLDLIAASTMLRPRPYDTEGVLAKLQQQLPPKRALPQKAKVRSLWPYFSYATAAILVTAVAAFFFFYHETSLSTDMGGQLRAELPDGSVVEIHANSSLRYRKWGFDDQRKVSLLGEAFFEVQRGAGFEVITQNGGVSVLGTSFNVKARNEKLEVACYSGKVQVNSGNVRERLEAGNAVQITNGQKTKSWNVPTEGRPEWQSGQTHFEQASLAEVIEELESIYGIRVLRASSFVGLQYTGTIPHGSVNAALKLVMEPLQLQYDYDPDTRTVTILNKP